MTASPRSIADRLFHGEPAAAGRADLRPVTVNLSLASHTLHLRALREASELFTEPCSSSPQIDFFQWELEPHGLPWNRESGRPRRARLELEQHAEHVLPFRSR